MSTASDGGEVLSQEALSVSIYVFGALLEGVGGGGGKDNPLYSQTFACICDLVHFPSLALNICCLVTL